MSTIKTERALRKVAEGGDFMSTIGKGVDTVSNWLGKNPGWGRALGYGGATLLGGGLLLSLLSAKNPMRWAVPLALATGIYGYNKNKIDPWVKNFTELPSPWENQKKGDGTSDNSAASAAIV